MIRYSFFSFLSGLLFALGLSVSGMTEPGKVIGFLNITRSWDPSLVFVMGGAVITYFILFKLIHKRSAPLFALQFSISERKDIDLPFLGGAVLFGIGWTRRFLPRTCCGFDFHRKTECFSLCRQDDFGNGDCGPTSPVALREDKILPQPRFLENRQP